MKFIDSDKIGYCAYCRKEGSEIPAVASIGKKKICAYHIVELALEFYGSNILGLKKSNQKFVNRILDNLADEIISHRDKQIKDEIGLL